MHTHVLEITFNRACLVDFTRSADLAIFWNETFRENIAFVLMINEKIENVRNYREKS